MHILFIDDNAETRELFRLAFTLKGHTIDTAPNGQEALRLLAQSASSPDVIILDHHMPGMMGLEVVEQLRAQNDWTLPPIILCTGDATGRVEKQAQELGVARVLYKPVTPFSIFAVIQQVIH